MRTYKRDQDDKATSIARCYFDAEQGRIELALERIADLFDEFPGDGDVHYLHGLLLRDYLGRGLEARDAFEAAFENSESTSDIPGLAACNITSLSRDQQEFDCWAETAVQLMPEDEGIRMLRELGHNARESGADYHATIANLAAAAAERGDGGSAAAQIEIALRGSFRLSEELDLRRHRAQWLRTLDVKAAQTREMLNEFFAPAERLALHGAMDEIERAIVLDEYDAELWNLRSAWAMLLRQDAEAIDFADKAIALRPHRYAKPWINKANALWHLGRANEARAAGREAIRRAEEAGDIKDRASAEALATVNGSANDRPSDAAFAEWLSEFVKAASLSSRKEISRPGWSGNYNTLVKGFRDRTRPLGKSWDSKYLGIMSELLTYVTPETVLQTLLRARKKNLSSFDHALNAALYIAAKAKGVQQRDATRLLCLAILGVPSVSSARQAYRLSVLETSAAAEDELRNLDTIMRCELGRINLWLPKVIADQPPVDDLGRERARHAIISRASLHGSEPKPAPDSGRLGCLGVIAVLLAFLLWYRWPALAGTFQAGRIHVPILFGLLIAAVVTFFLAGIGFQRMMRAHTCAVCSGPFTKSRNPDWIDMPGVMISAAEMSRGLQGIGRECLICGRTYCSNCDVPDEGCVCGGTDLRMVRLVYDRR